MKTQILKIALIALAAVVGVNGQEEYSNCNTSIIKSGNKIDRKKVCEMGVFTGAGKIVIRQTKNPCFFIDKQMWEMWNGKKIDDNTISFTAQNGRSNVITSFNDGTRPDLGHSIVFKKDGSMTNSDDGYETIQVLGKSKQCYLSPTTEEWTLYGKKLGIGREIVGRAKFYLK